MKTQHDLARLDDMLSRGGQKSCMRRLARMKTQHDLARLDDMLSTSMLVLDGDACWRPATSDTSDGAEEPMRSLAGGSLPPCIPIENQPPP